MKLFEMKHIKKSFDGLEVLKDISLDVEEGEVLSIIGPSGSGKSTILRCATGLETPDSGEIIKNGDVGLVFQQFNLFKEKNARENVMMGLTHVQNKSKEEAEKIADDLLDKVGLSERKEFFPSQLSGGQQQRVAIARAIVLQPKYLFCDEPNSGLDPLTSIVIDNLLHELTHEYDMTTVINTHDMNSVFEIGEKVLFIHEGHKEWEGSNEEIMYTNNKALNEFLFSSKLNRMVREKLGQKG